MCVSEAMNKIIDNLWVGSLAATRDADLLHKNGIKSILSVMRGKIAIQKNFARCQIPLDDTDDADALAHFPTCIDWINSQLKKGRGVLVHCQGGISRSPTVVAAYLMYSHKLDVEAALDMIRKARPEIRPNEGFMAQLTVFHGANYKHTPRNKETRAFYVDRAVKEVLNGGGSALEMSMFAKYPRSPADSIPNTPTPQPRRRIRCKMCRQELATREHMIDHGQVGPATPAANHALTPAASRRPSAGEAIALPRRGFSAADQTPNTIRTSETANLAQTPSFPVAAVGTTPTNSSEPLVPVGATLTDRKRRTSGTEIVAPSRRKSGSNTFGELSMTSMTESQSGRRSSNLEKANRKSLLGIEDVDTNQQIKDNDGLSTSAIDSDGSDEVCEPGVYVDKDKAAAGSAPVTAAGSRRALSSPQELNAKVHSNLAALRASPLITALNSGGSLEMTPMKDGMTGGKQQRTNIDSVSPPFLMPNAKCSGYFVEPMRWMEPFLESGNIAGKITCPNKKCGAKLGNYDWAGVECSCKEWVVPGFCIHRSKVDEMVV